MSSVANEPKISIIIPAYNVEEYIQECLESCLNQDYENVEVIAIDDASDDDTYLILKNFQNNYSGIRVLQNESNMGVSATRNRGLLLAEGEYILFVDADDYIARNLCTKVMENIAKYGGGDSPMASL